MKKIKRKLAIFMSALLICTMIFPNQGIVNALSYKDNTQVEKTTTTETAKETTTAKEVTTAKEATTTKEATTAKETTTAKEATTAKGKKSVKTVNSKAVDESPGNIAQDGNKVKLSFHTNSYNGPEINAGTVVKRDEKIYVKLDVEYSDTAGSKPTVNKPNMEYTFPSGVHGVSQNAQSFYDDKNAYMGTYTISEGKLTINYDQKWLGAHTSTIKTNVGFAFQLVKTDVADKDEVKFDFPGVSESLIIKLNDGSVTGSKEASDPDENGYTTFTIKLNADADVANVKVTDVLGNDLTYIDNSFQLDGASITPTINGQTATFEIGKLTHGEHKITYKVKLKDNAKPDANGNYTNQSNSASWTWNTNQNGGPAVATAKYYRVCIDKTHNSSIGNDGNITWTVKLNSGNSKIDMSGYKFTDTLSGTNHKYTGVAVVSDESGNEIATITLDSSKKTFDYTFGNDAGKKAYTITYKTEPVEKPSTPGSVTYTNTGTITKGDESYSDEDSYTWEEGVPGGIVTKDITSDNANTNGKVSWEVVIAASKLESAGGISDVTFQDDFNDYSEKDHVEFLDDTVVVKVGNTTLQKGTDYTVSYEKVNGSTKNCQMNLRFSDSYKAKNPKITEDITITYDTQCDKTPGTYRNYAHAWFQVNGKQYDQADSKDFTVDNTNYVKKNGLYTSENKLTTWTVYGNCQNTWDNTGVKDYNGEALTLKDTIPKGMKYKAGTAKFALRTSANFNPTFQEVDDSNVQYNEETRELTVEVSGVHKDVVMITYQTELTQDAMDGVNGSKIFTNNAQMFHGEDSIGSANAEVTIGQKILSKTSEQNDALVKYSIHVNESKLDLVSNSNEVVLEDTLDKKTEVIDTSYKMINADTNEDISSQCKAAVKDGVLTITVPDETHVLVTYNVRLIGTINDWGTYTNTVKLSGKDSITANDQKNYQIKESTAGGSGRSDVVTIHKVNDANNMESLKGAKFDLYRVDLAKVTSKDDIEENAEKVQTETTDESGYLTFAKEENDTTGATGLHLNQLYYYVETDAPDGYKLDAAKHYFMLEGSNDEYKEQTVKLEKLGIATPTSETNQMVSNEKYDNNVKISKVDIAGAELAGASLKITEDTVDGDVVDEWVSGDDKNKNEDGTPKMHETTLQAGTYVLTETTAPDGYEKAESITFTVDKNGNVKVEGSAVDKITMTDAYSKDNVTFSKQDVAGAEIAGASISIYKTNADGEKTGDAITSWVSKAGESHTVDFGKEGLHYGETYIMEETTAPEGYKKAESITFSIDEKGNVKVEGSAVDKITMTDAYSKDNVTFSKQDVAGAEIAGASISIYKTNADGEKTGDAITSWVSKAGESH
ncbi:MAG: SpaA isopeptide-forming pilin-related protein, partial [Anaerostipes sp.]|nr:SpaA isopeptide-forming pilin-related protein [Anaerostipes sp.]